MKHHAVQYTPAAPPVIYRFDSLQDRDKFVSDWSHLRRAIAAPADTSGFILGPVSMLDGPAVKAAFRIATIDDLFPPVTALRDAMIDKLKGAAVSS